MFKSGSNLIQAMALSLGLGASTFAGFLLPAGFSGTVEQNNQEAIIFHDGEREELVLKIDYKINGRVPPDRIGWFITLPHPPDYYGEVDRSIFQQVFDWASPQVSAKPHSKGSVPGVSRQKKVKENIPGKPARVGPYEIHAVPGRGKVAYENLNDWLRKNQFPVEDTRPLKFFIKNDYTYLCIKINAARGDRTVGRSGEAPPIHISFKSDALYYPLRTSARQGEFDVTVYTFTETKLDYLKSSRNLEHINWDSRHLTPNLPIQTFKFPYALSRVYEKSAFKKDKQRTWHLNMIRTTDTNQRMNLGKLKGDFFFSTTEK